MSLSALDRMTEFIAATHSLPRMINSPGLDAAFEIVASSLPDLRVHEFAPGEAAEDWIVPESWELVNAWLRDARGQVIASSADSPLLVAAYSEPVSGYFTKAEIAPHVRCHPVLPDAYFMEHRNAYDYSLRDWGITLPRQVWDSLSESERYEVHIEVLTDRARSMKVGEMFIRGRREEIISFTAHIDELCNDNLSSCAVLIELFRELASLSAPPNYSYQLLLVPETIGSFFYIANNTEKVRRTVAMVNLETVGRGQDWVIKESLHAPRYIDRLMRAAASQVFETFRVGSFFDGYGNDERVFEYPTISIPSVALQRHPFDEYHSSSDTPELLSAEHLTTALNFVRRIYDLLERDYIPRYTHLLPPWLTRHGLYFDSKDEPELFERFMNQVQFSIDGETSLVEICARYEIQFDSLYDHLRLFAERGFLDSEPVRDQWEK